MLKKLNRIIKDNRKYILLSFLLLLLGVIVGFIFKNQFQEYVQAVFKRMSGVVNQVDNITNPFSLLLLILKNNILAVISMIAIGLLSFGIYAIISLILNGVIIGFLMSMYAGAGVNPWGIFTVGLLPHGIFEFPAIILACAIGIRLGVLAIQWLSGLLFGQKREKTKRNVQLFLKDFPFLFGTVIVLLIIAAAVESYITPGLLHAYFNVDELGVIKETFR
ncbi:MAG TPA: hypothetical protein DDY49_02425 [Paenibacillaceae bacterium]|mgnify:CR=1 FL=1|nr:hypothetical protein [Paenibacillaceae bacterium]